MVRSWPTNSRRISASPASPGDQSLTRPSRPAVRTSPERGRCATRVTGLACAFQLCVTAPSRQEVTAADPSCPPERIRPAPAAHNQLTPAPPCAGTIARPACAPTTDGAPPEAYRPSGLELKQPIARENGEEDGARRAKMTTSDVVPNEARYCNNGAIFGIRREVTTGTARRRRRPPPRLLPASRHHVLSQ